MRTVMNDWCQNFKPFLSYRPGIVQLKPTEFLGNFMNLRKSSQRPSTNLLSGLVAYSFLLASVPVNAAWDYSLAAKLAIYDYIEADCRHLVPALFDEVKEHIIFLSPQEKLQANQARQSDEYIKVLQEIGQPALNQRLPDGREKTQECTRDLQQYRLHL